MKELKEERDDFGGTDGRAINKHSVRVYEHKGAKYQLDRNNSGCPPYFTLYKIPEENGLGQEIKVDFKPGCTWDKAIATMEKKITRKEQGMSL